MMFSRYVIYPVWDIYDSSIKLKEWKRLQKAQYDAPGEREERRLRKLQEVTETARARSPYYREKNLPRITEVSDLRHWPLLTKKDVRENLTRFIPEDIQPETLIESKTGGSTGIALRLLFDKRCEEKRNAAAIWTNRWSGWDFGDKVGALWGNPPKAVTFKQKVRSALLDRLYFLDTVKLDAPSMNAFVETLKKEKIHYLFGHARSLYMLALKVIRDQDRGLQVRGIVSTSMVLLPTERAAIEKAFQCRVQNRYGCEEVGLIASQCEESKEFHLNDEHLIVEFLDAQNQPVRPGEEGKIVLTDLNNVGAPLIRYEVGDMGVPSNQSCPCGRTTAMMSALTGRQADFLVGEGGVLVAGVSLVERTLTAIPGIEALQLVQDKENEVTANVVPESNFTSDKEEKLITALKDALGQSFKVTVEKKDALSQTGGGKYRFSICNLSPPLGTLAP